MGCQIRVQSPTLMNPAHFSGLQCHESQHTIAVHVHVAFTQYLPLQVYRVLQLGVHGEQQGCRGPAHASGPKEH